MKVLVTGYSGFIGKNLLTHLGGKCETITLVGDVNDLGSCVSVGHADATVHLAGANRGSTGQVLYTNICGTLNVAQVAAQHNKHLVYIGTQYKKKNFYRASKDTAAFMVKSMSENMGFPATILYLPQVFGPQCRPYYNSFVSTLLHLMAKDQPYEHMIKDENELFSLVHVDEVCKKIEQALNHPPMNKCHEWHIHGITMPLKDVIETIRGNRRGPLHDELRRTYDWYKNNDIQRTY